MNYIVDLFDIQPKIDSTVLARYVLLFFERGTLWALEFSI